MPWVENYCFNIFMFHNRYFRQKEEKKSKNIRVGLENIIGFSLLGRPKTECKFLGLMLITNSPQVKYAPSFQPYFGQPRLPTIYQCHVYAKELTSNGKREHT